MESNMELFIQFHELRHGWFDAKIKKPMEHISMNTLNTIVANDMENSKLGEAGFDEHDIFSPPSMEEKIYFDDTLPPIYDDYGDEFAPTITNKIDYAYVESNNFMHVAHDKNVSCDSYIVDFINDATESYYERGKHGYMHLNNIKFPLFMLRILKLLVFYPLMLVTLFFMNSFVYKIPLHRKWVRLKCVLNLPLDALFLFQILFLASASLKLLSPS
jgi:hypothetical protein